MKPEQVSCDAEVNITKETGQSYHTIFHCQWIFQLYTKPFPEMPPAVLWHSSARTTPTQPAPNSSFHSSSSSTWHSCLFSTWCLQCKFSKSRLLLPSAACSFHCKPLLAREPAETAAVWNNFPQPCCARVTQQKGEVKQKLHCACTRSKKMFHCCQRSGNSRWQWCLKF